MKNHSKPLNCLTSLFLFYIILFAPKSTFCEDKKEPKQEIKKPHVLFTIPSEQFRYNSKLNRPSDVTVYQGNIYIADSFNENIVAFNELGETLYVIGGHGSKEGEFLTPVSVTADEDNLYVADMYNFRIQVFDRVRGSFKFIIDFKAKTETPTADQSGIKQEVEESLNPLAITLDTKDNLYVCFRSKHFIKVYDKEGNFKSQYYKKGMADGELALPTSIAVNNFSSEVETKLYVVDSMNYRVQIFNEKFKFLNKFGTHSDNSDGFLQPSEISIDNQGRIYVYDRAKSRCIVFDKDGKYQFDFGRDEKLAFAEGMYIDVNNKIYIADTLNNRIVVYGY